MKHTFLALLLVGAAACNSQPADHFVLRGTVPGTMDSTEVVLSPEGETWNRIAQGYIIGEKFELQGKLPYPTCCRLAISNGDLAQRKGIRDDNLIKYVEIPFFAENGNLTFQTPHIDSLPRSFWAYDIRKEKNYTLKGSPAQDVFFRYQQQTIPYRYNINFYKDAYQERGDMADYKTLLDNRQKLETIVRSFIQENNNLYVNLFLAESLKRSPFTYDQAYLDELESLFASVQDTCAPLRQFRQYLQDARTFVQGKALEDGEITDPKGKTLSLTAQLNPEGYTFIDFWASWCGPCRASFPHLRKMHEQYGKQVKFISISVDQKEAEWQQAMKEEQLPWGQYLSGKTLSKAIGDLYDITAIPTFLLIDPQGKIVFSGHSSGDLEMELGKL